MSNIMSIGAWIQALLLFAPISAWSLVYFFSRSQGRWIPMGFVLWDICRMESLAVPELTVLMTIIEKIWWVHITETEIEENVREREEWELGEEWELWPRGVVVSSPTPLPDPHFPFTGSAANWGDSDSLLGINKTSDWHLIWLGINQTSVFWYCIWWRNIYCLYLVPF